MAEKPIILPKDCEWKISRWALTHPQREAERPRLGEPGYTTMYPETISISGLSFWIHTDLLAPPWHSEGGDRMRLHAYSGELPYGCYPNGDIALRLHLFTLGMHDPTAPYFTVSGVTRAITKYRGIGEDMEELQTSSEELQRYIDYATSLDQLCLDTRAAA